MRKQIIGTFGIIVLGFVLGVIQKWIDGTPSNFFPLIIQQLDIGNCFGRLAIWILLAAIISVYSKSPLISSVNTFSFFISMLAGYYIYCNYVSGFLPKAYILMWIGISFVTPFMAYICWYAKGQGLAAVVISSAIIGMLFAQAFSLTQGFYVYNVMEVATWIVGIIILFRKSKKEFALELILSFPIAFLYQLFIPHFG